MNAPSIAPQSATQSGSLYIVATPIGHPDDITFRAVAVLDQVNVVVCEERSQALQLLTRHNIKAELVELNEHTVHDATLECLKLLANGKSLALISDAGTPVIADPGGELVRAAIRKGYAVHVVPGPSSILAAVVCSGMALDQFLYVGFLDRKKDKRDEQIRRLALEPRTLVLLEAPYRLVALLESICRFMPDRRAYIGCNLTMPDEHHHYGTVAELAEHFSAHPFRGEFVVVIEGNSDIHRWYTLLRSTVNSTNTGNRSMHERDMWRTPTKHSHKRGRHRHSR
ncbi:MAG: 16S rRNA (cytidine(1402)-2'-O)-methyltransferase [Chlorobi bacterium]|nr:16S rRNA (cytidine(1402)-2'-O)-methyltransferase [Chlorobiota bacterium]